MVVSIVVFSIVIAIVTPHFDRPIKLSQQQKELIHINSLSKVISRIKEDTGTFPTSETGLELININVNEDNKWKGPYTGKKIEFIDLWGNNLIYKYPHNCEKRLNSYALYSAGENGIDECMAGDDIYMKNLIKRTVTRNQRLEASDVLLTAL